MPSVTLPCSPHAPGVSPIEIAYRSEGRGAPLLYLHGGWGYGAYPFDEQIRALADRFQILVPDRSGFGRSSPTPRLPERFHAAAATETALFLDAVGVRSAFLWGHSDGAVIAARLAIEHPERARGVILEATHFTGAKWRSVEFFEQGRRPDELSPELRATLARDHGEDRWRTVISSGGEAWLALIEEARQGKRDLFDGRLPELRPPVLVLHGEDDPRTEPGELEAVRAALPRAIVHVLRGVGHCPHTSRRGAESTTRIARAFLEAVVGPPSP